MVGAWRLAPHFRCMAPLPAAGICWCWNFAAVSATPLLMATTSVSSCNCCIWSWGHPRLRCLVLHAAADPFSVLVVMSERHPFLGKIVTGRVHSGSVAVGDRLKVLWRDGE